MGEPKWTRSGINRASHNFDLPIDRHPWSPTILACPLILVAIFPAVVIFPCCNGPPASRNYRLHNPGRSHGPRSEKVETELIASLFASLHSHFSNCSVVSTLETRVCARERPSVSQSHVFSPWSESSWTMRTSSLPIRSRSCGQCEDLFHGYEQLRPNRLTLSQPA